MEAFSLDFFQESELAQHLWKKDMQNSQNDYAAAVTILNRTLIEGRVSAAVARRKYDKAATATSRVSRKLRKVRRVACFRRCCGKRRYAKHRR